MSGEFVLVTAVHITQQTWRCSWCLHPSPDGRESLAEMLCSPCKLPCSETPRRGSAGTLALPGTSSTAAPAEARGELGLSVILAPSHPLALLSPTPAQGRSVPVPGFGSLQLMAGASPT